MSVTYEIQSDLIQTRCQGQTTLPEVLAHFDALEKDRRRPAHPSVLLDLTEQTSLPTPDQIRAAANRIGLSKWLIDFRACAIVVEGDALFGMLRIFEVFAHGHFERLRVFRDAGQARAWLAGQHEHESQAHA